MVAKRAFNFFYHFDFIYKRSALYQEDRKNVEAAERLPNKVIEKQKEIYFSENPIGSHTITDEIDENDDEKFYETPQIFLRQLFRLYSKGLIDDKNIRDQIFLMVK